MKRKYYATWGLVIILASLAATSVRFYVYQGSRPYRGTKTAFKVPMSVPVPDLQTIREMEQLEGMMDRLVQPRESDRSPVELRLFGYEPMARGKYPEKKNLILPPSEMNYSLTLAFRGGKSRFCVIDGRFYKEGATLKDGGKILAIEPRRVLIRKGRFQEWVTVGKPEESVNSRTRRSGGSM